MSEFDIVITVGAKDVDNVRNTIPYTKCNVLGYRNIYIVSVDPSLRVDGCITIAEDMFPFSTDTVTKLHGKLERNPWYLQQLIKLYAGRVIPGILDRWLVLDSDLYFLRPTKFINEQDQCMYSFADENWKFYFDHMARMNPEWKRVHEDKSGITHHMMMEKKYIEEIFVDVESRYHDDAGFYETFLKCVHHGRRCHAGASEYEMYFNYMLLNHADKIEVRELKFSECRGLFDIDPNVDCMSWHWHHRC